MKNIFLEKSYTKCGGETISRHSSKKSKLSISLDQYSKIVYSLFLLYIKFEDYRNILKFIFKQLGFTTYKASLQKKKKRSGTSLLASFSV